MASEVDVIIVGAGCAGLTAAIGLARNGFTVAIVEAAKEAGGMIGGVCFAESLIQPDILGPDGVESLSWERRLIERGSFATDGRRLAGYIYRDAKAFFPCYTILRSRFNRSLAEAARTYPIALHSETTVESLIRDGRRIIGVATTRGPLYSRLIFLAEGDAGLLVSREELDRSSDPRDQPAFLYCLQQVFETPPGAIEKCFGVEADQGVAYDLLLRNPDSMPLNARGQICTNRQGLTLSVFLPVANLQRWFAGEPRQLLDWFADMPVLRPWLNETQHGAWTATLLRTGGIRDVPYLIEDGLVVGGAAAGLGGDFPVLNLTGPATATGLLLSRAAGRIRDEGRNFDRDALTHHYLTPLQQSRYWRDREFVQRWPGHLERTPILFGHGLDLLLDSASVWSRPRRWLLWKLLTWLRVLAGVSWGRWNEMRSELLLLARVLHWREVTPRPALARLLLDGALNAFRDLARRPRPHLPPSGSLRLHYRAADEEGRASAAPRFFRRWFERFRPVLAAMGSILHANDDSQLSVKLTYTSELFLRQINLFDVLAVAALAFPVVMATSMLAAAGRIYRWIRRRPSRENVPSVGWAESSRSTMLSSVGLEDSAHPTPTPPLIRIAWRSTQPQQQVDSVSDLPRICPTGVFQIRGAASEAMQVIIHADKCIFCQACWRTNPLIDWGRNVDFPPPLFVKARTDTGSQSKWRSLLDELEHKLWEFDAVLGEGSALVDRPHNDYLEMLARYSRQLAYRIREILHSDSQIEGKSQRQIHELADALVARAEERTRRAWEGRFSWAAADGRLLRQHHLALLRRLLNVPAVEIATQRLPALPFDWIPDMKWMQCEDADVKHLVANLAARRYLLETLQRLVPSEERIRDELLSALSAEVRECLAAYTSELNSRIDGKSVSVVPNHVSTIDEGYRRQGRFLLENPQETCKFLDVPGDWSQMAQLDVLRAEREELVEAQRRLIELASAWEEASPQTEDDEISARFGRQAAHLLAGKLLLLRTFACLEKGDDAELIFVLLRVWLDHTALLLDEFSIVARERIHPVLHRSDRPLIDPDSGAPLRTQAEYLDATESYTSGDFLVFPLDLVQPRLVAEMVAEKEIAVAGPNAAGLLQLLREIKGRDPRRLSSPHSLYLAEALAVETIGRYAANPSAVLDLELACARLILAELCQASGALRERCVIVQTLVEIVVPRLLSGGTDTRARHLERDALELEAIKADFRRRLTAGWQVFGDALGRDADVQASCFALAEAAAWSKAADSILGRMAWLSRLCQAEDREEPATQQDLARRVLAHCFAEIRDRLFRFDEDLASLRRGYYAPHVYAARILRRRLPQ